MFAIMTDLSAVSVEEIITTNEVWQSIASTVHTPAVQTLYPELYTESERFHTVWLNIKPWFL